eukprot:6869410-Pyramimonas_sp.AAC.1
MPHWVFRNACGQSHLGRRWGSLWGHEALYWVGKMPHCVFGTHADGGTGAFGGVPYGATRRCIVWAKMPKLVFRDARGRSHWWFRWSPP